MASSITETVTGTAEQIHEKLASASLGSKNIAADDGPAPAVQAPSVEHQHKEALKLSGALDHFESFDVTPVIGREFVGVNLAKWLRAPNSDELIRDLAITSIPLQHHADEEQTLTSDSLSAWCSLLSQTGRRNE